MINPIELRTGNWVMNKGNYYRVGIPRSLTFTVIGSSKHIYYNDAIAIPILPDILEKSGFYKYPTDD